MRFFQRFFNVKGLIQFEIHEALNLGHKLVGMVGETGTLPVHAMILTKIENGHYVFKNSYGYGNTSPLMQEYVHVPVASPAWSNVSR